MGGNKGFRLHRYLGLATKPCWIRDRSKTDAKTSACCKDPDLRIVVSIYDEWLKGNKRKCQLLGFQGNELASSRRRASNCNSGLLILAANDLFCSAEEKL
jgi:hypothetical protein